MELGDLNTLMLKDEEDFNYRHNKKLLEYIFELYKEEYFQNFKNFEEIFQKKENFLKENNTYFPMIEYNAIKISVKKIFLKILFKEILLGLKFIHSQGISHRDIKPENIVYSTKDKCCKIIDFSISIICEKSEENRKFFTKEPGGSIHFQAPEQYEMGSYNPFVSDIWSLGISIYIFLFEVYPFDCNSDSELELQINICNQKVKFPEYVYDNDDDNLLLVTFIEALLEKDPIKRLGLDEIKEKLEKL